MFGEECVDMNDKNSLAITVDGKTACVNLETRVSIKLWDVPVLRDVYSDRGVFVVQTVEYDDTNAEDDSLREMVELAVQRLYEAMNPTMWDEQKSTETF